MDFTQQIKKYKDHWLKMDVGKMIINCPYFANKIRNGEVVLSGFKGGKGNFIDIKNELNRIITVNPSISTKEGIFKLARRKRVGIDCSGFVYRFITELIKLKYQNCEVSSLEQVLPKGIYGTNADELTDGNHLIKLGSFSQLRLGDLIRMNNGHHVVVVVENENDEITYIHSSNATKVSGVHTGKIMVNDDGSIIWRENSKGNINFGDKYFHPQIRDGIFRLKIFNT